MYSDGYKVHYISFMISKLKYKLVMDLVLFELWELINVRIPNLYASYSISMLHISTLLYFMWHMLLIDC